MKTSNPYDEAIPDDTDILLAHNPAKGYVDNDGGRKHGCESSAKMVERKLPRAYVCGHVHFARGTRKVGDVLFVNGSNVEEAKKGTPTEKEATEEKNQVGEKGYVYEQRAYDMLDEGRPIVVQI